MQTLYGWYGAVRQAFIANPMMFMLVALGLVVAICFIGDLRDILREAKQAERRRRR